MTASSCPVAVGRDVPIAPHTILDNLVGRSVPRPPHATRPTFLEIKVAKGARPDLGRPKEPPQINKALFMETLAKAT